MKRPNRRNENGRVLCKDWFGHTELDKLKGLLCDLQRAEELARRERQEIHQSIGRQLRTARIGAGLSLREVARRLRKSAPYVSDLERGRRAWNLELLGHVAEALCEKGKL